MRQVMCEKEICVWGARFSKDGAPNACTNSYSDELPASKLPLIESSETICIL